MARELRATGLSAEVGDGSFRLKKSFETADRIARQIVILGEDEVAKGEATVKTFTTGEQQRISQVQLIATLKSLSSVLDTA